MIGKFHLVTVHGAQGLEWLRIGILGDDKKLDFHYDVVDRQQESTP
jgi:hypothetical protein